MYDSYQIYLFYHALYIIELRDDSKEYICEWEPNYNLENYIVSANIQAVK